MKFTLYAISVLAAAMLALAGFSGVAGAAGRPGAHHGQDAGPLTTDRANSVRATVHRCPYYYFCWYSGNDYQGTLHLTKTCNVYYKVPQASIGSYYNNQTPGTQARFYDWSGDYFMSSRPAPASEPAPWPDSWRISSILACHT